MFKFETWCGVTETHIVTFDIDCHFVRYVETNHLNGNIYYIFSKENPSRFNVDILCDNINGEYLWVLYRGKIVECDEKSIEVSLSEYLDCSKLYFSEYDKGRLISIYKIHQIEKTKISYTRIDFPTKDEDNLNISSITCLFRDFFRWSKLDYTPELKSVFERRIKEICNLCLQK